MNRNRLFALVGLVLVAVIVVAAFLLLSEDEDADNTEEKNYEIGILVMDHMVREAERFQDEMTQRGFVEGENVTYQVYMFEEGEIPDEATVAGFDVIMALEAGDSPEEPLGRAFELSNEKTPIVFVADNDYPIVGGYIESLGRPGKNVTGIMETNVQDLRLELFIEMLPDVSRMLVVYDVSEPDVNETVDTLTSLAESLGVELVFLPIEDFGNYVADFDNDIDAVFSLGAHDIFADLVEFALAQQLPMSDDGTNVEPLGIDEKGYSLLRFDVDTDSMSAQAAGVVEQILDGTNPADIPIENAQSIITIDLVNAQILGIELEDSILQRANVIVRPE